MRKFVVIALLMLSALWVTAGAVHSQEDMRVVGNGAFNDARRAPAVFAHDVHNETAGIDDCAQCHHLFDDSGRKIEDESSEDQSCADCHALKDQGRVPGLRKAFHRNCKGCHLEQRQGPVTCAQCHIKE